MLSLATTGVMAADSVTTSVNNGDQLTKYQKEAIQLTQKLLANKAVQDSKTYEHALALNETRTINLALANNRTAKQTKWGYEAAKICCKSSSCWEKSKCKLCLECTENWRRHW